MRSTDGTGLGEALAEPPDGESEGSSPAAGEPPLHPLSNAAEATTETTADQWGRGMPEATTR